MHFHKYPYAANFEFATRLADGKLKTRKGAYNCTIRNSADGVFHLQVKGGGWQSNESQSNLDFRASKATIGPQLHFAEGRLTLRDADGSILVESAPKRFFGQCGDSSLFEFIKEKGDQFYGMGEKWTGFEHSGKTTKFWNTDVWADFHPESYIHGKPASDPVYVSVPYLILKRKNRFFGFLLDNPHAGFISTGFKISIAEQMEVIPAGEEFAEVVIEGEKTETKAVKRQAPAGFIHLGSEEGQPNLYVLVGPSLPELTRKLQKLVGPTPRPPGWALGYHQCRWGYESEKDLNGLDASFRKDGIPVDGLWLDIDYMRGYRVFTFEQKHFPNPQKAMAKFGAKDRKVIPIIDPGVKWEKGYDVYERGKKADAFCRNSQGLEYVGLVWPGQTVFPDYSLPSARKWWADEVAEFARLGIFGAWLDMNDPATGPADNQEMRFDHGKKNHSTFHNQYALGMAQATYEGFLQAHPDERPFLLCRSGFTGTSRYTAIWTGDNFSNYYHLKNSIATTLNLALSGIPFNGPDVGGFGGDSTPALIQDWFKACFLFPIFRNHSLKNTRKQEPWAFGPSVMKVLRKHIQLRYRLRPYLYQLFIENERNGEAILRPLFYDFQDSSKLPLGLVDDQFMVGPSLLQAPFVEEGLKSRSVVLPGGTKWFDVTMGSWTAGGRKVTVKPKADSTPIFIRDQSILPLARLEPSSNAFDPARVDFHVFLAADGTAKSRYEFDDGSSFAYQKGAFTQLEIQAIRKGTSLQVTTQTVHEGNGKVDFTLTTLAEIQNVWIDGVPARKTTAQGIAMGNFKAFSWKR